MESIASVMSSFVFKTILALPITRDTFAQVIDGIPTRTPFSDEIKSSRFTYSKTIIVNRIVKPSHKTVQEFDEIKTTITLQDLLIELKMHSLFVLIFYFVQSYLAQLALRYQDAPQDSLEYLLHLLEIAAASVYALAGSLCASSHENMETKPPKPPEGRSRLFDRTDEFYVNFHHTNYRQFEKYTFGLLNVVGYWAEAEIFGVVVLFEHEGGLGIAKAFLHPQKTSYAFQLSETQLQCFTDLSRPGDPAKNIGAETLLPFAQGPAARTELTFAHVEDPPLRIYKNEYDQPPVSHYPRRRRCVKSQDELPVSVCEALEIAKKRGWLDQRQVSPSTEKNAPLSKDDQPSVDEKGP